MEHTLALHTGPRPSGLFYRAARLVLSGALALVAAGLPAAPPARAAAFTVTNALDDGPGSLRQAVLAANAIPGADIITFDLPAGSTIALTSGALPDVSGALTLDGSTASNVTVSGSRAGRVLVIRSGAVVTVTALTLAGGRAEDGGAVYNAGRLALIDSALFDNSAVRGGGVFNAGALLVYQGSFTGNDANIGGGIFNTGSVLIADSALSGNSAANGGGMYNQSQLTLIGSTVISNSASVGGGVYNVRALVARDSALAGNRASLGGGLANDGTLALTSSTVSGNQAYANGGGLYNTGTLTATNSTFYQNSASDLGSGGGLYNSAKARLRNTIVAGNPGGNCVGVILNDGNNLDDGVSCGWGATSGSRSETDPKLGPYANNGGGTATHALLADSPAIDAANPAHCPQADQRGRPRLNRCDIGAYEAAPDLVLSQSASPLDPAPGQLITYTIVINNRGALPVTQAVVSNTLSYAVSYVGPVLLDPPTAGSAGAPSVLAYGLTIPAGQALAITFPARVGSDVSDGTLIANSVTVSSAETTTSVSHAMTITVTSPRRSVFLPFLVN